MEQLTRSGRRLTSLNILLIFVLILFASSLSAQTPLICNTASTNQVVHAEGLAEPVGTLILNCSGGTAGQILTTNITADFPAAITNRINSAGVPDISLTLDTGSGPAVTGNAPLLIAANSVSFNGVSITIPARGFILALTNVRLGVNQLAPGSSVVARLSAAGLSLTSATATVATLMTGLLANGSNTAITCTGSPLPTTFSVANFFAAGTRFNSLRVTEGFGNAFIPKDAKSDTGTRIVVNYSGFPTGSRVFVPDYVAGNSATQATAGGDLGGVQSAGVYTPTGGGTLLLARVLTTDSNGAGGTLIGVASQFVGATTLGNVTEVPLTNGSGIAVYEVIDSNAFTQESAQFPTFLGLTASGNQPIVAANAAVSIGPVSNVKTATAGDPIPRFFQSAPPSDCTFIGDCNANYFPILSVTAAPNPITFQSPANGLQQINFIQVNNLGGGSLIYTATVTYQNGSGYVFVDPPQASGNSTIRVVLSAAGLTPGTYQAAVIISAGAAGSSTIPITITVAAPTISVTSVTNAATLVAGPLVAGSLATLKGTNLAGTNVGVTLDGIAAPILFKNASQINFQVPATLAGRPTTQLVVMVDNIVSAAQTIQLTASAPGIFGVLNQDGTVNATGVPAAPGSIIQIYATGLATNMGFTVTAGVDIFANLAPLYAGDAPGIPGVQQVNVLVPAAVTTGQLKLQICSSNGTVSGCSPQTALTVR